MEDPEALAEQAIGYVGQHRVTAKKKSEGMDARLRGEGLDGWP